MFQFGVGVVEGAINSAVELGQMVTPITGMYLNAKTLIQGERAHAWVPFDGPTNASRAGGRFAGPFVAGALPLGPALELATLGRLGGAVETTNAFRGMATLERWGPYEIPRSVPNDIIPGFNAIESNVIHEARGIFSSAEMGRIEAAHVAGEPISVNVGGRLIQYEPDLPASGMTMFGENGFLIGREAFVSQVELQNTVLHELYRLNTSASAAGVSSSLAAQETKAAFDFAARARKQIGEN
jgi:hypothetical protein